METAFCRNALEQGLRIDWRSYSDYRQLTIEKTKQGTLVSLGKTMCFASISVDITTPNHPTEGIISFDTIGLERENSIMLQKHLEKSIRKAVEVESLCIIAGERVFQVTIVVQVINDEGNILDCAHIAALLTILSYKRPDVLVEGNDITLYSAEEREQIPLTLFYHPISITFLIIDGKVIVDGTREEESAGETLSIVVNEHGELVGIWKVGVPVDEELILKCCSIARVKAKEILAVIKNLNTKKKLI